ncbi:hypothetical protein PoB_004646700 [Plakobranchus ocellatus]|uniref:Uncharacterized protein n=1 Tax=Plakobranchus ocellatus TaxID=259542 RepID=A0AAV4BKQ6_9GAST|nr:hypothetical protein PoB_004646700 [Plakobranchus ocellatus]
MRLGALDQPEIDRVIVGHLVLTLRDHHASLQQNDLRLSGPPLGQGADDESRTRDRRVPVDLRADSQVL